MVTKGATVFFLSLTPLLKNIYTKKKKKKITHYKVLNSSSEKLVNVLVYEYKHVLKTSLKPLQQKPYKNMILYAT